MTLLLFVAELIWIKTIKYQLLSMKDHIILKQKTEYYIKSSKQLMKRE